MKTYKEVIANVEKTLFEGALKTAKYNQSKAARILQISRGTFRTKLRLYFGDKYLNTRG